MPLVVAFISQKGGVGKSTLARGLATFAVANGSKTKVADRDLQQRTAIVWETTRARHGVKPVVDVQAFDTIKEALSAAKPSSTPTVRSSLTLASALCPIRDARGRQMSSPRRARAPRQPRARALLWRLAWPLRPR